MVVLRYLYLLALSIWVGGLVALGGLAAPTIFQWLEAQQGASGRVLAAALVGELLRRFHLVGYLCGAIVTLSLVAMAVLGPRPLAFGLRAATATLMLALTLYSGMMLSGRIERLRSEIGVPVHSLSADDPRRAQFGRLHGLSTAVMLVTLAGGLILLFCDAYESRLEHWRDVLVTHHASSPALQGREGDLK